MQMPRLFVVLFDWTTFCRPKNATDQSEDKNTKTNVTFWRLFCILLKILCWKIHDFSKFTSNRHRCFEKDLLTIVVARSTESYFQVDFSFKAIIRGDDYSWG